MTTNLSTIFSAESAFVSFTAQAEQSRDQLATAFADWLGLPDFAGYNAKRGEYLESRRAFYANAGKPVSDEAHASAWERNVKLIGAAFEYVKPKSAGAAATQKGESRAKLDAQAATYLSKKGAPTVEQVQQAAIAKITGNKEAKAEAAIILAADKSAKAKAKESEADARKEALGLIKSADLRHLQLVLAALKVAIPADADATIKVEKKKAAKK